MWEIVQVNESMLALKKKKNSVENEKKNPKCETWNFFGSTFE